jgi:hypothetical protein
MRFAEHLEDECDSFVCLAGNFDGRSIRDPVLWGNRVFPNLQKFLSAGKLRQEDHAVLLECHLSVSYAAGYLLHRASGTSVFPVQKGPTRAVWKPAATPLAQFADKQWKLDRVENQDGQGGMVLGVSITHDIRSDVDAHLRSSGVAPRSFLDLRPVAGVGPSSVRGADHAAALAEQLQQIVMEERRRLDGPIPVHLFAAAPNSVMYFLGQLGRAIDPVVLYEFDFDEHAGYSPSFSFPPRDSG